MKKYIFWLIAPLIFFTCGNKEVSIKKYYFPYTEFFTAKVYKYTDSKDSNQVMYCYFKTDIKKGDTLLTTCFYNTTFKLTNVFLNGITENGSIVQQVYVSLGDTLKMFQCTVDKNDAFSWKIKPKQTLFVSFKMGGAEKEESQEIVTERSFEEKKEKITFNGKEYECLLVKESTLFNRIVTNRTITQEQQRNSYYGEGVGLLQFETFNANGTSNLFTLKKILDENEWEKLLPSTPDSSGTASK
jgi:hypothetical protein